MNFEISPSLRQDFGWHGTPPSADPEQSGVEMT